MSNRSEPSVVLVTEPLAPIAATWLEARAEVYHCQPPEETFDDLLPRASGLIVRTYTQVDAALLELAPNLRVVGRAGVGLDNIDLQACRDRGVEVVYTPDANTQAVVEYVLGHIFAYLRPHVALEQSVPVDTWRELRSPERAGRQFNELLIGILGLGRIGRLLAAAATGLGASVIYHDLLDIKVPDRGGASPVPLEELLSRSNVLSIHVDGRRSNRHLLNETCLRALNPDALVINTSRGFIVDKTSLASFLQEHSQAAAVLDVHDPEPIESHCPLLGLANAQLYPHLAGRTATALLNMSWVVRDVVAVLEGQTPEYPAGSGFA